VAKRRIIARYAADSCFGIHLRKRKNKSNRLPSFCFFISKFQRDLKGSKKKKKIASEKSVNSGRRMEKIIKEKKGGGVIDLGDGDKKTSEARFLQFLGEALESGDAGDLVVVNQLAGTSVSFDSAFGKAPDDDSFIGCHIVPIVDIESKEAIGRGSECIWEYEEGAADTLSFFVFDCGAFVQAASIALVDFPDAGNNAVVFGDPYSPTGRYITTYLPQSGANSIVEATGCFEGREGTLRLSGVLGKTPLAYWFNYFWEVFVS
jgi:hypothetical protein